MSQSQQPVLHFGYHFYQLVLTCHPLFLWCLRCLFLWKFKYFFIFICLQRSKSIANQKLKWIYIKWIVQFPTDLVTFTEEILNGKLHASLFVQLSTWKVTFYTDFVIIIALAYLILWRWSLSTPLENIRKSMVFWYFQGVWKETNGIQQVNENMEKLPYWSYQ